MLQKWNISFKFEINVPKMEYFVKNSNLPFLKKNLKKFKTNDEKSTPFYFIPPSFCFVFCVDRRTTRKI